MTQPSLEDRVKVLEQEFETFKKSLRTSRTPSSWIETFGMFAEDSEFDEVLRLGREYREQENQKPLP